MREISKRNPILFDELYKSNKIFAKKLCRYICKNISTIFKKQHMHGPSNVYCLLTRIIDEIKDLHVNQLSKNSNLIRKYGTFNLTIDEFTGDFLSNYLALESIINFSKNILCIEVIGAKNKKIEKNDINKLIEHFFFSYPCINLSNSEIDQEFLECVNKNNHQVISTVDNKSAELDLSDGKNNYFQTITPILKIIPQKLILSPDRDRLFMRHYTEMNYKTKKRNSRLTNYVEINNSPGSTVNIGDKAANSNMSKIKKV